MNRNVVMLSGLFAVSYAGLLWLMPRDPRQSAPLESASVTLPLVSSHQETMVTEPSPPEVERIADESVPAVTDIEEQAMETDAAEPPVAPSTPLPTIEAAAYALRSDSDRRIRLAAVDSLLRLGSRSNVDPAITQALRDAATDADQTVAAQAGSALIEVERTTH